METYSALLALCAGNSPVTGEFSAQRPATQSFDVFFDLRLNKQLSKQSWVGNLRRHRGHYDVNVMTLQGGWSQHFIIILLWGFAEADVSIYAIPINQHQVLSHGSEDLLRCAPQPTAATHLLGKQATVLSVQTLVPWSTGGGTEVFDLTEDKIYANIFITRTISFKTPLYYEKGFGHIVNTKIATVSQTILSNAFAWMKTFEIKTIFHWNVFRWVYLIICHQFR